MEDAVMPNDDIPLGSVQVFHFTDADAFVQAYDTCDAEYIRLVNVSFQAELIHLDLGAFRLRLARFNTPHEGSAPAKATTIVRAGFKADRGTLRVPVGEMTAAIHNGRELKADDLVLVAPGADLHTVFRRHQDWAALDFTAEAFEALLDLWGLPPLSRGTQRTLNLGRWGDAAALPAALAAAAALARAMPRAMATPGFVPSVREEIRALLMRVLSAQGVHGAEPPRRTRDLLRSVGAADGYLRAHVARPIYTDELCSALAVSPRKLHDAFVATYGVSPHAYLKLRRLSLVRRALGAGDPSARLVKSMALSHGFWHMGRFAHDYVALFGEMPSQTLAAAATWRSARTATT
jgi:AraC-like DNA-binding protein